MKPVIDHPLALKMLKDGKPVAEVADYFMCGREAIYTILRTKGVSSGLRAQLRNPQIPGETLKQREVRKRNFTGDLSDSRYMRRDPCPKCGVRGDIGCKHFPKEQN